MSKIQRRSAIAQAATVASASIALINVAVPQFRDDYQSPSFLPEDLIVAEILPRLTAKTLMRFKCASKLYQSIISHPKFARNYLQRAYNTSPESLGLGLGSTLLFPSTNLSPFRDVLSKNVKGLSTSLDSVCYDRQDQLSISLSSLSLPYDDSHKFLASSNGLILSSPSCIRRGGKWIYDHPESLTLYVSNPLTKQLVKLPQNSVYGGFGCYMATRQDYTATFLTYKIVAISGLLSRSPGPDPKHYRTKVDIFSSDTGSWVTCYASARYPVRFRKLINPDEAFCHKGVLYWFDRALRIVITYNPYDSPGRFDSLQLPNGCTLGNPSLMIYSGDEERVKFCEIQECESGVDRMSVWRLEDDSGWLLEGDFRFPSFSCRPMAKRMVALNPWNRDVFCHPYVRKNKVTLIDTRNGTWKSVDVFTGSEEEHRISSSPLVSVELSPWSSPFYVQPQLGN